MSIQSVEERKAIKDELKAKKILLRRFQTMLKSLDKQAEKVKAKRLEKVRSLREYKTYEEAHEAYGWGFISENEFHTIADMIEKGDAEIENALSPCEIAADTVRGYIKILRSDIDCLEFELLPPEEQERQREISYQRTLKQLQKQNDRSN